MAKQPNKRVPKRPLKPLANNNLPGQYTTEMIVAEIIQRRLKKLQSTYTLLIWIQDELGYKKTAAYRFLKKANDRIVEMNKDWAKNAIDKSIKELEQMREEALKGGDKKLALEITKELNKVMGLDKMEIKHTGELKISTIRLTEVKKKDDEIE